MTSLIAIAVGGAVGAVLRFLTANGVHSLVGREFPYGTLTVNVLGSLCMGFLYVLLLERMDLGPAWRSLLLVGLLGSFTTFSTFSIETLNLIEAGEQLRAAMNIVASILLCLLAVWAGVVLARQI